MKRELSTEEAFERLEEEIETIADSAEGHVEDAAYWWKRVIGSKAEAVGDTLQAVVGPCEVYTLMKSLLRDRLEQSQGDPDRLAELWTQICPHAAQVYGEGLLVEVDE